MAETVAFLLEKLEYIEQQIRIHDLKASSLHRQKDEVTKELQDTCTHPDTEQESDYFNGSYDEVARTFYRLRCTTCKLVLKSWDKAHNWYG